MIKQKNHSKRFGEFEFEYFGGSYVANKLYLSQYELKKDLVFYKYSSCKSADLAGSQYRCHIEQRCLQLVPGLENLDLFIGFRCDYLVCLWKSFHKRIDGNQYLLKAVYYTRVVHNFDLQEKTTSTLK